MQTKDLKVITLDITEDNYEFRALFRLHGGNLSMDVDLERLSDTEQLERIRETFSIDEEDKVITDTIMAKVMEASSLESRQTDGSNGEGSKVSDVIQRNIDSLSTS